MGVITTVMSDDLLHWDWTNGDSVHSVVGDWYLPMAAYADSSGIHMLEFWTSWNPVSIPVTFTGLEMNGWWSFNIYWTPGSQYSSYIREDFSIQQSFYRIEYWPASYDIEASVSIAYVPGPSIPLIVAAFLCLLKKGSRNAR